MLSEDDDNTVLHNEDMMEIYSPPYQASIGVAKLIPEINVDVSDLYS
jgi:hypothetical protein